MRRSEPAEVEGEAATPQSAGAPVGARREPGQPTQSLDEQFEDLFRRRYAPLVRLAILLGASREVAEEKVMDAFARIAPRLESVAAPDAYLRTSVVNGIHSHHRRLRTVRNHPHPRPPVTENPEIDELWQRIGDLGRSERTCVVLRYYEDLPVREIATELDMPIGTVKSHLHRGIAALRELLSEEQS